MSQPTRIRPRDRDAILQSLAAGVVPHRGHQHIQVGRHRELAAVVGDLDRIVDGGSAVRFVIGEYGSGKTFFLHLVRSVAIEKGLVTLHADLTPDRRLWGTGGQARTLYAELARNLATRTQPEGGAMTSVVERFVTSARQEATGDARPVGRVIRERLARLAEMVGGYDFAAVIGAYWRGHEEGDTALKDAAVRWLRGEYTTKTDARNDLGVRTFVDDQNVYDHLKLLARFVHLAGYGGLLVCLDEMVNLYKLTNSRSRKANYEQVLRIVNDGLQGGVEYLGFLMGGTPEFLMDTRRGLYSYEALQSRLSENVFVQNGYRDLSGPVIRLANLSPEELYVLLTRLRRVQAAGETVREPLPDEALRAFMEHCQERIGARYFQTPRNTIKAFVQLMAVLEQNPEATWKELVGQVDVEEDREPSLEPIEEESGEDAGGEAATGSQDLASFQL